MGYRALPGLDLLFHSVVLWDDNGVGLDSEGNVVICACGELQPDEEHVCPYVKADSEPVAE